MKTGFAHPTRRHRHPDSTSRACSRASCRSSSQSSSWSPRSSCWSFSAHFCHFSDAQEVEPFTLEQVADNLLSRLLLVSAIVVTPIVVVLGGLDESERRGGRTYTRSVRRALAPRYET
jgi:hypothetical protein